MMNVNFSESFLPDFRRPHRDPFSGAVDVPGTFMAGCQALISSEIVG